VASEPFWTFRRRMFCTCKESNDVHPVTTNACSNYAIVVSFEVLAGVVLFQILWRVTPYGLVIAYRHFERSYFLQSSPVALVCLTVKIKAVRPFETSIAYLPVGTA